MARAALRRRWWTASVRVWTGATTIESPVCTPSGSTFSIEHTAMHVSSASRMTSYSTSCQPTRQRSTMTCLIGLARRPGPDPLAVGGLGLDDAAAGPAEREGRPDDRRQPDGLEGAVGGGLALGVRRALDDDAGGVRLADPIEQVAERLAVLGHPDGLERRAQQLDVVALEDAGLREGHRQVERRLATEAGQQALGLLAGDDRLDRLDGERLEVDDVRHGRVGHDRGRVAVDEDRPDALGAQGAAGLRAGVVELRGLADDHRPGSEDQDGRRLRTGRCHERDPDRRSSAAATNRSNTASASSGPGAPSGWYWTVSIGRSRWRRPSTDPSLRLTWLTRNPLRSGRVCAHHLDFVVLGGHLDESELQVLDRVVRPVMPERAAGSSPRRRPARRSGGPGRSPAADARRR